MDEVNQKFTFWTKEQAEQWAKEYVDNRDALVSIDAAKRAGFLMGMAKAEAEFTKMIEACPTIYRTENDLWVELHELDVDSTDTHQAKLVGVKPISE